MDVTDLIDLIDYSKGGIYIYYMVDDLNLDDSGYLVQF